MPKQAPSTNAAPKAEVPAQAELSQPISVEVLRELCQAMREVRQVVEQTFGTKGAGRAGLALEKYPTNMRINQVARYLDVSAQHVTNLIDDEALPAIDVASKRGKRKQYRVKRADVAAYELRSKADPNK